jgi:hypothetical protein
MARFEEIQMKIAESAKKFLDIYNMQVFIEQFTLDRESKVSLTLREMKPPFPVSATVSFTYDAFQTGATLYEENEYEGDDTDIDTSVNLEFVVRLPIMKGSPDIDSLLDEIEDEYPDAGPYLEIKEVFGAEEPFKEYKIVYGYDIEAEDIMDSELFDEIFDELKGILDLTYKRTRDYMDLSWYEDEE